MSVTEAQLRQFIETVFNKYDYDRTGHLNAQELASFFNDVFAGLGQPTRFNQAQALEALRAIDQNSDGMASKQ